jgi:tetratricopeptide (TPR) repeat protein
VGVSGKVFMRPGIARALILAAGAIALAACNTTGDLASQSAQSGDAAPPGAAASALASASDASPLGPPGAGDGLLGSDPNDELSLGKKMYRANNFGMAETHFRRAVELHPRDAEAWLGLAASYDRLRRFDLADRAYAEATKIVGATVEILNNEGYSLMLRGDYKRARAKLAAADRKDPGNKFVANNLRLLDESIVQGKQVE